jgi:ketosteroid isomerase-like protein
MAGTAENNAWGRSSPELTGTPSTSRQDQRNGFMESTLQDRVEALEAIEGMRRAVYSYVTFLDAGNRERHLDVFTEDAVLQTVNMPPIMREGTFRGKAEVSSWYAKPTTLPLVKHYVSNLIVTPEGKDRGSGSAYWSYVSPLPDGNVRIASGVYRHVFRREADGVWRIAVLFIMRTLGLGGDNVAEPNGAAFAVDMPTP